MKLSDYMAFFLSKHVGHAFVGQGGCIVHLLDSLTKTSSKVIPCQNEQGASISAEAYARITGGLGLAIATSGPGMINLLQGMACAHFDSIPSIFIVGAPPRPHLKGSRNVRQFGFQETEVVQIVKPISKYAVLITDPKKIRYELEKMLYHATHGRKGPVVMDLPDDLQREEVDPDDLEPFIPEEVQSKIDADQIDQTLDLIKNARRPVVIVGGGVKIGQVESLTFEFLKKSNLPYLATWATIDLFKDDEPNFAGSFGVSSTRPGNFVVQNSDLIISLGSRLDTHEVGSNASKFAPLAKKIVIDIDDSELNKDNGMVTDVKFCCDLKDFLEVVNPKEIQTQNLDPWMKKIADWRGKYPACLPEYYSQEDTVNPYVLMEELSKKVEEDSIVIPDAGGNLTWTMQAFKVRSSQMLFSAFNHSPMGYALPAAIGAQFAAPQRQVICIIGDGGIQMNIQELETVAFYKLPIKIFLINNGGYGIIKQTQDTWLDSNYVGADPDNGLGIPDFVKISRAYGIQAMEMRNHQELDEKIRMVLGFNGPVLCDVKLDPNQKIAPKLTWGRPLEDLEPFLPREEFAANMKI